MLPEDHLLEAIAETLFFKAVPYSEAKTQLINMCEMLGGTVKEIHATGSSVELHINSQCIEIHENHDKRIEHKWVVIEK